MESGESLKSRLQEARRRKTDALGTCTSVRVIHATGNNWLCVL